MKRTKKITQIGYVIGGTATLFLWGGGEGTIEMKNTFIPNDKFSKTNMLRAVNDNGFGCEAIKEAEIDVFIKYDNGSVELERTFFVDHPIHTQHFLGWRHLKELGIK